MHYLANGAMQFDDIFEMYYYLFSEIGLAINSAQYLYDMDTGIVLKYKDKYIKATTIPQNIYAGKNDIVFEPEKNYNLMVNMMGYYIDKEAEQNDNDIGFIAQYTEYDDTEEQQRVVIETSNGTICSKYYHNIYLGYLECIFIISGNTSVDLRNFDNIIYF